MGRVHSLFAAALGVGLGVAYELIIGGEVLFYFLAPLVVLTACLAVGLRKFLVITLVFCTSFTIAGWRSIQETNSQYNYSNNFIGVVSALPDVRESHTEYVVTNVDDGVSLLIFSPRYPEYAYGDVLRVQGKMEIPQSINDNGRVFDYGNYLHATKNVMLVSFYPKVTLEESGKGNWLLDKLYTFRSSLLAHAHRLYGEPNGALLLGMILGDKQSLGKELMNDFREVGLVHVVVLSGYNMSIVASWMLILFRIFGHRISIISAIVAIILFSLLAGGGATVWRAAIMATIAMFAQLIGRSYVIDRALLAAFVVMVLIEPLVLIYDPSFQLSFLATAGLIYVTPLITSKFLKSIRSNYLKELMGTMLGAQFVVMPLLLFQTGMLSIAALPSNFLVLPFVPLTMLLGTLSIFASYLSFMIGLAISIPAQVLLGYALFVVEYLSSFTFASFLVRPFPIGLAIGVYLLIAAYVVYHRVYPDEQPRQ